MAGRIQRQLWEVALDQDGFVTTADAHRLGIPVVELGKLAHRGQLGRAGWGIYRFEQLPAGPYAAYRLAVLWAGGRAALSHDTALDLYELCDINPSEIHLTVSPAYRPRGKQRGPYVVHHERLTEDQLGWIEGIRAVRPGVAIAQGIRSGVPSHLLAAAIDTARARGLVPRESFDELRAMLDKR